MAISLRGITKLGLGSFPLVPALERKTRGNVVHINRFGDRRFTITGNNQNQFS